MSNILPWRTSGEQNWIVGTKVGNYVVRFYDGYWSWHLNALNRKDGLCDNAEHGKKICESDYLSRITEFVPVVKLGQVAVDRTMLAKLHNDLMLAHDAAPIDNPCWKYLGMWIQELGAILDATSPTTNPDAKPTQGLETVMDSADEKGGKTE